MREAYKCQTPLMQAMLINLSVLCMWYLLEYLQFGCLQTYRKCDDAVFIAYSAVTYLLCRRCRYLERRDGR